MRLDVCSSSVDSYPVATIGVFARLHNPQALLFGEGASIIHKLLELFVLGRTHMVSHGYLLERIH